MNEEKSGCLIPRVIDSTLNFLASEEPEGWEKSSAIIYEIMNFILRHKDAGDRQFSRDYFCSSLNKINVHDEKGNFTCEEAISFGVRENWIEEVGDEIIITDHGFGTEKEIWGTYR